MPRRALRRSVLWPLLCAAASAWALEVPLRYVRILDVEGPGKGDGFQKLVLTTSPPESDYELPAVSGPCYFALAALGGEKRCFLFTAKKAGDTPHSRLFFDADGNHDFTDNPPIDKSPLPEELEPGDFAPIDITVGTGGAAVPYSFRVFLYKDWRDTDEPATKDAPPFGAFLESNCAYTGTLKLDGKEYTLTLRDGNANGLFSDKLGPAPATGDWSDIPRPDLLCLDDGTDRTGSVPLCDLLLLGDKLFRVTPDVAAGKLTLDFVTAGLAGVALPAGLGRLILCPAGEGVSVCMIAPPAAVKLPPGTYRFMMYDLTRMDADGDTWQLEAYGTPDSLPLVVGSQGTTAVSFGEPFTASVVVEAEKLPAPRLFGFPLGPGQNIVRLNLTLQGAAKEEVATIVHAAGHSTKFALNHTGFMPKEPGYRIASAADETLATGMLSYERSDARGFIWSASWDGAKDGATYKISCTYHMGPFKCQGSTIETTPFPAQKDAKQAR